MWSKLYYNSVEKLYHLTFFCPTINEISINYFSDIDECRDGLDDCDEFANCTNTMGAFDCTCQNGFVGNGTTCAGNEKSLSSKFSLEPFAKIADSVNENCFCLEILPLRPRQCYKTEVYIEEKFVAVACQKKNNRLFETNEYFDFSNTDAVCRVNIHAALSNKSNAYWPFNCIIKVIWIFSTKVIFVGMVRQAQSTRF